MFVRVARVGMVLRLWFVLTHVIIWGIKEESAPGQENMVQRAKSYIKHQVNQGVDLMTPAPVVAEAMISGEVDDLRTIRTIIESSFFIPAFDSPAAFLAAELERSREVDELRKKGQVPRNHIRIDTQIAAIAITQNADMIISHDPYMRTIVQNRIQVIEIPDIPEQENLQFSQ